MMSIFELISTFERFLLITERKYITISESFKLRKCKYASIKHGLFYFFKKNYEIIVKRYICFKKKLFISVLIKERRYE